ncbi:MAG: hypothetical protein K2P70_19050 [Hyphomonadaceae bacterium]|nr:hypothetical protein [Hyphomonadaceae bacterium]
MQYFVFPSIGVAIAIVLVIFIGGFTGRYREDVHFGLWPAVIAYAIVLFVYGPVSRAYPEAGSIWIAMIGVAPLVEEFARVLFFKSNGAPVSAVRWLFVGLGFGLFETVLKFNDLLVQVFTLNELPARILVFPLVPLTLHVLLSVTACWALRAKWSGLAVFGLTWTLHAAHNTSALLIPNAEMSMVDPLMRAGIYVALISIIVVYARRRDPVTTPHLHANTAPHEFRPDQA